ncbi:hypothetical protein HOU02_gp382 [Caulobacter phage CcrBL9]|uniref:Uncharacterized protein n=1 Tax=Caulobacter phage CcrBL9 TaxID=2283270 RepID=A0A385EC35_9CAUD|nr:hypothetical protein HOU02_gp382 [Caulobacter phage CcrBL9]AXQ69343.1 hypothetical protein CcrBL9_gp319 [Caulobacter phage CcrBL9]
MDCCDVCGADADLAVDAALGGLLRDYPDPITIEHWMGEEDPYVLLSARKSFAVDGDAVRRAFWVSNIDLGINADGVTDVTIAFRDALCFTRKMAEGLMETYKGEYIAVPYEVARRINTLSNRFHYIRGEYAKGIAQGHEEVTLDRRTMLLDMYRSDAYVLLTEHALWKPRAFMWSKANDRTDNTPHLTEAGAYDWDEARMVRSLMPSSFFILPCDLAGRLVYLDIYTQSLVENVTGGILTLKMGEPA